MACERVKKGQVEEGKLILILLTVVSCVSCAFMRKILKALKVIKSLLRRSRGLFLYL